MNESSLAITKVPEHKEGKPLGYRVENDCEVIEQNVNVFDERSKEDHLHEEDDTSNVIWNVGVDPI